MPIIEESIRKSVGNGKVVRLLCDLIDDRWIDDIKEKKRYLVVVYDEKYDKYIPKYDPSKKNIDRLYIWPEKVYPEMAGVPKIRNKMQQVKYARGLFKKCKIEKYWFDDFSSAQDKFIELAKKHCMNDEKRWIAGKTI